MPVVAPRILGDIVAVVAAVAVCQAPGALPAGPVAREGLAALVAAPAALFAAPAALISAPAAVRAGVADLRARQL